MDYEKKYKEAVNKIKNLLDDGEKNGFTIVTYKTDLESIFPELKESEDERIRKAMIALFKGQIPSTSKEDNKKFVAWLEKQGKVESDNDDIEVEEKGIREAFNKIEDEKQCKQKPFDYKNQGTQNSHKFNIGDIISNGNVEFRIDNIVKNCVGQNCYFLVNIEDEKKGIRYLQLTDSRGNHSYLGEITWLCEQVDELFEKQGEQKPQRMISAEVKEAMYNKPVDKIEPKFKVGDKIKLVEEPEYSAREIIAIKNDAYYFDEVVYFPFSRQDEWELVKQKSVDKAKSKFKVGDWITNGRYNKLIVSIIGDWYMFEDGTSKRIKDIAKKYHLWTIQDAKDGDVLACENGWACIFNCLNDNLFSSHCFIDNEGWFCGDEGQVHMLDTITCGEIHPATKEQRDLLFQKIHEAGYKWDADKRELKKISQRMISAEAKEAMYAKTAWSEDDEKFFKTALWHISYSISNGESTDIRCDTTEWLKSLKQRIEG